MASTKVEIRDNRELRRVEAIDGDGEVAGFADYQISVDGQTFDFTHTEVDERFAGQGIGSQLAAGVVEFARSEGITIAVLTTTSQGRDPRHSAAVRDAIVEGLRDGTLAAPHHRTRAPGVALVGGGPGDPDLITVRGRRLLAEADVVIADRLGPRDLLDELPPHVEVIDAAKIPYGRYMAQEAAPTLGDLPGIDLPGYIATLLERFSNPSMRDTLVRLATDGSNRMPTFTLPPLRENLDAGRPVVLGAAMVAAWAEYWALIGRGEITGASVPDDVHAGEMTAAALDPRPTAFVEIDALFGDLPEREGFVEEYLSTRRSLAAHGVHPTLDRLLQL